MSTTKPSRTRLTPAQRSAQIQDAALAIAREDGLSALTLRAVASRAGVASGLITHYEPSIDELVARTFTAITAAELDELRALTASLPSPIAQMRALIRTLLADARDDVTLAWVESSALGRRNPALASAVQEQMTEWMRFISAIVSAGIADSSFTASDPVDTAWQLIGMIDGLNAQALLRRTDAELFVAQMARASEAILGAKGGSLG